MITTLFLIVVLGVVAYIIDTKVPMYDVVKLLFRLIVVLIVVFYLLSLIGVTTVPAGLKL